MAEIAAANVAAWPVGTTFPVAPEMNAITLEVILRTVLGTSDPARLAALRAVLPKLLDVGTWDTLAIAKPALQQSWPWQGLRRRIAEADRLLYAEIADHRADPDLATRTDVLAMLIRAADEDGRSMTDVELRDQLMTLLAAGHDTTATALAWALERLTRNPAVLDKAVRAAQASAAGDPAGDEYLDAVAKETLRIRPVVPDVGRVLKEPVELAGYRLPAGVMVVPGILLVHADAEVYPEPDRFDPDRMVGATLSPTTWFPFGAATVAAWARTSQWWRCGWCCGRSCTASSWIPPCSRRIPAAQARDTGAAARHTHPGSGDQGRPGNVCLASDGLIGGGGIFGPARTGWAQTGPGDRRSQQKPL